MFSPPAGSSANTDVTPPAPIVRQRYGRLEIEIATAIKLCDVSEASAHLSGYTTLGLGGPATNIVEATSAETIVDEVRNADSNGTPILLVAGGSNLVIGDGGFAGTALLLRNRGMSHRDDGDDVLVTIQAGHTWDDVVAHAVASGWSGIECLSGIPGSAGATPIQNVGAYGQEISETFAHATVYDRKTGQTQQFLPQQCRFAYRNSIFKRNERYIVLDVTYRLRRSDQSAPIRYAETARQLGIEAEQTVDLERARETVLKLRQGKGMVLDPQDRDTYSVGSFFVNPVVSTETFAQLREAAGEPPPSWPAGDNVKLSAAWLIGRSGFTRGYGHDGVAISTKHTLALTNRGDGSTTALLALAAEVRDGVYEKFGVALQPEPVLINADF